MRKERAEERRGEKRQGDEKGRLGGEKGDRMMRNESGW